jgi:hypothetical protein
MGTHLTMTELEEGLARAGESPADNGTLEMIVSRQGVGERLIIEQAELDAVLGLIGDNWLERGSKLTDDGSAHPESQIAIMNSRIIHLLAGDRARWPLAGDQLYIDFDVSSENLPAGQRLGIGTSLLEITEMAHTGCAKFTERFGHDAIRFVNSAEGRQMRRRGLFARIIQPGFVEVGDVVRKID